MIKALSQLPPDAKLVITQSGFYADSQFANIMLPEAFVIQDYNENIIYKIGHSHQWY